MSYHDDPWIGFDYEEVKAMTQDEAIKRDCALYVEWLSWHGEISPESRNRLLSYWIAGGCDPMGPRISEGT